MKKFVFIDESIRDQYTMAAVVVPITKVKEYRREMLALRSKGARSFHMGKERRQNQLRAIKILSQHELTELVVATSSQSIHVLARQECLSKILNYLDSGSYQFVLDATTQEGSDRKLFFKTFQSSRIPVNFIHLERHLDPGIWGADILAWAAGHKQSELGQITHL